MEDGPLLKVDNDDNTICKILCKCTCSRFVKLIEILLMALQITVVILDWSSSCNHALHMWMIVSLSYRLSSFIFQWICIEPCLIYLRRDRSSKISKEEDGACCYNLLFCWVLPWLWIIDNDIFLLIWTILGTLIIFDAHVIFNITCSWHYIQHHVYSKLFYYTMITVLSISYIYWLTTLVISISLFCCPQLIKNCCLKMGYAISRPKGHPKINSIMSVDASQISDMPGIRNTISYSITAPSRMNNSNLLTPAFTAHNVQPQPQYTPPNTNVTIKANQALPMHIFKQFKRKLFHKKKTLSKSDNLTVILTSPRQAAPDAVHAVISPPSTTNNLGIHSNANDNNHKQRESYDIKEAFETETKNPSLHSQTTINSEDMSYPIPATFKSDIQNGGDNSFSSMRHWLSAKRSKFSSEYISNLDPLPIDTYEQRINTKTVSVQDKNKIPASSKLSPYLTNTRLLLHADNRDTSPSISLILNVFDNVAGLNNLPSPNVLRRISKSLRNDKMIPLNLNDYTPERNSSVFAPPLTQRALDMKIARPSLFGRNTKKYSILKDINFIVDVGDNCCALCQNMYRNKETLIILSCNHQFHEICAVEWFKYKSVCPICRKIM